MSDVYPDWLDLDEDEPEPIEEDPDYQRELWLDARYDDTGSFVFDHVKVFAYTTLFTALILIYGLWPRGN